MKTYNCTISERGHEDFISTFQIKAKNLKEAYTYARHQKTKYHQTVECRLSR